MHFKKFISDLIQLGIDIGNIYEKKPPSMENLLNMLTPRRITTRMNSLAAEEKSRKLKLFQEKIFVNVQADAGTILGFPSIHAIISNPTIDEIFLIDSYYNNGFTSLDYQIFFNDIFEQIFKSNLVFASLIIDNLRAQMNGAKSLIEESPNVSLNTITIVPCFCHLTNLIFVSSLKNPLINEINMEIQSFVKLIRKKDVANWLGSLCPKIVKTRWLYILDSLRYILKNINELKVGIIQGLSFPRIPKTFFIFYELLLPIKALNLLGERRDSRLCYFVQHIQNAIRDFRELKKKYEGNEYAIKILDEITTNFYARIKSWKCFDVMVASYLCTLEGKYHVNEITVSSVRNNIIHSTSDIDVYVSQDYCFIPSYYDVKSAFKLELNDDDFELIIDEEEEDKAEENNRRKRKKLRQEKISDYVLKEDDNIVLRFVVKDEKEEEEEEEKIVEEEHDESDINIEQRNYKQEIEWQKSLTLDERLNQSMFYSNGQTMYSIARKFVYNYSSKLGYKSNFVISIFDKWIDTHPNSLHFKDYAIVGGDLELMWKKASQMDTSWECLSNICLRLITIGVSESDVERLFSKQKDMMGLRMTNIGSETLKSRLILRKNKMNI